MEFKLFYSQVTVLGTDGIVDRNQDSAWDFKKSFLVVIEKLGSMFS